MSIFPNAPCSYRAIRVRLTLTLLVPLIGIMLVRTCAAQDFSSFYYGKTINLIIGGGAGGGYDGYARLFARHGSKHIPGNPQFVPRNLPTANGLVAANTLFNSTEPDGLTIAALTSAVPLDPLFGRPGAQYEALKFGWIGSIGKLRGVCGVWHTVPVYSLEDLFLRETVVGGVGATSDSALWPRMLNELVGLKIKGISGYPEGGGVQLAVEKGEIEGICGMSWSTLITTRPQWQRDKLFRVLMQMGATKHPDLMQVPSLRDLVSDPERRKTLDLILMRGEMGHPFAVPPGTLGERLQVLRKAFEDTIFDHGFIAEAERDHLEIEPVTGVGIDTLLMQAYSMPIQTIRRAALLADPNSPLK
jgi:tripartite-type tricarboxylate transporter receptor subunit TctC